MTMHSSASPTNPAPEMLSMNPADAVPRIVDSIRRGIGESLRRRGLVVAMSGGIDSSVCAALAVRALGPARVFGLMLPERDSSPQSLQLAKELAEQLGIHYAVEDITSTLTAIGCYARRDDAMRRVVPEFTPDWKSKVVLGGNRLESDRLNVHYLVVERPNGERQRHRLPPAEYRQIVAATNFKQRVRKMLEYYHADRLHYAVVGTPNRLEYDQGFFVKGGDGLADIKPIAHLYKTQVYQLAEYLGIPEGIRTRPPTTDTYSLEQSQEEFFFALSARDMDAMLFASNAGMDIQQASEMLGFPPEQVERAYRDISQKRSTTRYLHQRPLLVEPVPQIELEVLDPQVRGTKL
jgi:NAD+ synthase